MTHTCPIHNVPLRVGDTRWGKLATCPEPSCDVRCWDGPTSTPADGTTRALRTACHEAFDELWVTGESELFAGINSRNRRRNVAYAWLAERLGIPREQAHFGSDRS